MPAVIISGKVKRRFNKSVFIFALIISLSFYSCQKDLFVESNPDELGNYYSALITSNPAGAQIYVDGKYSGHSTPDTISWLTRGEHSIRLRFNSVLDTVFSLSSTQPGLSSVHIDYLAVLNHYGNIYCTTEPSSAYIYLNDVYTARFTPDTIKYLLPGRYKIKYEQFRYRSDSTYVDVIGGKTSRVNLWLQDTTEWLDFRTANSKIPSDRIVCFKVDINNAVWIGTYDNGLAKLLNGRFTNFNTSNSPLPSNFITAIDIDENGNLWIGTMNGLVNYDGNDWEIYNQSRGLPSNYITSIYCNQDGGIYVGTKGGLGLINRGFVTNGTISGTPLLSKPVSSVTGNKTGALWIASEGGISSYVNDEWKVYTRGSHQLAGIDGGSIAIDAFGKIWCAFPANYSNYGNITGGLMYFDGTNWKEYILPNSVKGRIQKITADYRGNVWLATPAGVYMLVPEGGYYTFSNRAFAMVTPNSMDILVDKKDKVWFALWEGGVVKCKLKML